MIVIPGERVSLSEAIKLEIKSVDGKEVLSFCSVGQRCCRVPLCIYTG
jgi:hypothetical protein